MNPYEVTTKSIQKDKLLKNMGWLIYSLMKTKTRN